VWTRDPDAESLATLSYYVADPDIRRRPWLMRRDRTTMRSALVQGPAASLRAVGGTGVLSLKSATVSFGQELDQRVLAAAVEAAADCDVFLAVGTSLQVWPVAGLTEIAAAHGARIVIVNAEPTPFDDLAGLVVREPIGTALPGLVARC
jgi:NAD-dependent protein deacetylase/lipoamidase